jgi:hypothetical protein
MILFVQVHNSYYYEIYRVQVKNYRLLRLQYAETKLVHHYHYLMNNLFVRIVDGAMYVTRMCVCVL